MILLFLGSWRSTLVVAISIPLSILTSLLILSMLGQTINIMTLGGLALAVGILVDDATVEIENINRLLPEGMPLRETILTGAQQIAVPAFVATLSICIVFVPIFFLKGVPGFLFRPLAEAVVFAMLASYFLSRTLVPTLVMYLFHSERKRERARAAEAQPGLFRRFHLGFEASFERFRERYVRHARVVPRPSLGFRGRLPGILRRVLALDPDAGRRPVSRPWMRGRFACTCARRSARASRRRRASCDRVEQSHPPADFARAISRESSITSDFPISGINLTLSNSGVIGTSDAEILISLTPEHRTKPVDYIRTLRRTLPREFPGTEFYFQPADIVSQVLNFGLPAPIDVQLAGQNVRQNYDLARKLLPELKACPGPRMCTSIRPTISRNWTSPSTAPRPKKWA